MISGEFIDTECFTSGFLMFRITPSFILTKSTDSCNLDVKVYTHSPRYLKCYKWKERLALYIIYMVPTLQPTFPYVAYSWVLK